MSCNVMYYNGAGGVGRQREGGRGLVGCCKGVARG